VIVATVHLWGTLIGRVGWEDGARAAVFEYDEAFLRSGIEVAPLTMPLGGLRYSFPALNPDSFHGLPGLLADSLPDRFGNAVIDAWLAARGRTPGSFSPVERLCYIGHRGLGALEYEPAIGPGSRTVDADAISVAALVRLAGRILTDRESFRGTLDGRSAEGTMRSMLLVGTSAGGARAKAVIGWNPETGAVSSGQVDVPPGFQHWILKFDGVSANRDRELADPAGYGLIEFAYSRMARDAGIDMPETNLLEEGPRRHFMVRRFDRTADGDRVHMQSLAAIDHLDFNDPNANAYEQAFGVIRRLGLPATDMEQMYRRMVFNLVARNQDDHVKNTAFLMDRAGVWRLAPAFDVTYAYQPDGAWTGRHQMSVNGRRDGFTMADLAAAAATAGLKRGRHRTILREVTEAVTEWPTYAEAAGVAPETARLIGAAHRLDLPE